MSKYTNVNINIDEKLLDYLCEKRNKELEKENKRLDEENAKLLFERTQEYEEICNQCKQLKKENVQLRYAKDTCKEQQSRQADTIHKIREENKQLKALLRNAHRQAEIGRSYVQQYCSPQQDIRYTKRVDNVRNQLREELGNDYLTLASKYLQRIW